MGRLCFLAVATTLTMGASVVHCAETPAALAPEVKRAEQLGRLMLDAEATPRSSDSEELVSRARGKVSSLCQFEYKPIVATFDSHRFVFFIAQPPKPDYMVFGRHFAVDGDNIVASTNTCIAVPPTPPDKPAVAAYITHVLSETPTEFHVYLSLKHHKPVYVGTSAGNWLVDGDKVSFLGKR